MKCRLVGPNKFHQSLRHFFSFVLLHKVACTPNFGVVQTCSARNSFLPHPLAALGHWVARAEQGDEGFGPSFVHVPRTFIGLSGGIAGVNGHLGWKHPSAYFEAAVGVGCIVSGHSFIT